MANGIMSALGAVYKGIVARLTRKGVKVGGTASYPRVEVHSVIEQEPLDMGGTVRSISCIVESISEDRMAEVVGLNEGNLEQLSMALNLGADWRIVGIQQGQLQQITETSETNKILYRLLQNITVYVQLI